MDRSRQPTDTELNTVRMIGEWLETARNWNKNYVNLIPSEVTACHSALFQRILAGLAPLPFPPPNIYGYPNYDLVESETPRKIYIDRENTEDDMYKGILSSYEQIWDAEKLSYNPVQITELEKGFKIYLEQATWEIVEVISPTNYIIKYADCEQAPWVYRLWYSKENTENSYIWNLLNNEFYKEEIRTERFVFKSEDGARITIFTNKGEEHAYEKALVRAAEARKKMQDIPGVLNKELEGVVKVTLDKNPINDPHAMKGDFEKKFNPS